MRDAGRSGAADSLDSGMRVDAAEGDVLVSLLWRLAVRFSANRVCVVVVVALQRCAILIWPRSPSTYCTKPNPAKGPSKISGGKFDLFLHSNCPPS